MDVGGSEDMWARGGAKVEKIVKTENIRLHKEIAGKLKVALEDENKMQELI